MSQGGERSQAAGLRQGRVFGGVSQISAQAILSKGPRFASVTMTGLRSSRTPTQTEVDLHLAGEMVQGLRVFVPTVHWKL